MLTSNKGFEEWGRILGDEVMAAALLDRLLHRCHIVNIRGNSYRMRRHVELSKAIHPLASRIDAEISGVRRGSVMTTSLPRSDRSAPFAGQPPNRDILHADNRDILHAD